MGDSRAFQRFHNPEERRRDLRVPVRIEVRFQESAQAARVLKAYSLNFSVGGICLRARKRYSVGTLLLLFVRIGREQYSLSGVVAWIRGKAIGVRFKDLDPSARRRFTKLVESTRS